MGNPWDQVESEYQGGTSGNPWDAVEADYQSAAPSEPQQTIGSFGGDAIDAFGGFGSHGLKSFFQTALKPADWLASGVNAGLDALGVPGSGNTLGGVSSPTDLIGKAFDTAYDNVGDQSAIGREFSRAGDLTGTTGGILTGAGSTKAIPYLGKVGKFLSSNPLAQLEASGFGGLVGQTGAEEGLYKPGSTAQTLTELGAMTGPDLIKSGLSGLRGIAGKFFQPAERASGEVLNTILGTLDDPSVITRPSGTGSAQALREDRLGEIAKGARTAVGQEVGVAKDELANLSPELADDAARLSLLKKEKRFPSGNTDLGAVSAEIDAINQKLASVPSTITHPSPFPLVNAAHGNIIPNIGPTTTVNPIRGAVDDLIASKGDFSDLATELKTVFKTGKDISGQAYEEAASKVGARLKQPQAARAFVELAGGHPEMLSIGKSSILQNMFSGTPTSWARKIDESRGALQEIFTPHQIDGLHAIAQKNRNLVGGWFGANVTRLLGSKLATLGLTGAGAFGGVPGMIAGHAVAKFAKAVGEKPQLMQTALSKAFQSGEAATLLSQKATPRNIRKALEYFGEAGKKVLMGEAAQDGKSNAEDSKLDNSPAVDEKFQKILDTETQAHDEDSPLVKAVIKQESGGKINAISPKGAEGLMQLMPATGKEWHDRLGLPGEYDPKDPDQNKKIGTAYLNHLVDKYGDVEFALAAYNYGLGRIDKLLKRTGATSFSEIKDRVPMETRQYVKNIMKDYTRA